MRFDIQIDFLLFIDIIYFSVWIIVILTFLNWSEESKWIVDTGRASNARHAFFKYWHRICTEETTKKEANFSQTRKGQNYGQIQSEVLAGFAAETDFIRELHIKAILLGSWNCQFPKIIRSSIFAEFPSKYPYSPLKFY